MNSERPLETLVRRVASPDQEDRDATLKAIEAEIASCGLNPKQIISAWIESYWKSWLNEGETTTNGFPGGLPAIMERNLYVLERLAYYDKTSPKRLNKNFGITCFGRYDPDMLINQLQTADHIAFPLLCHSRNPERLERRSLLRRANLCPTGHRPCPNSPACLDQSI